MLRQVLAVAWFPLLWPGRVLWHGLRPRHAFDRRSPVAGRHLLAQAFFTDGAPSPTIRPQVPEPCGRPGVVVWRPRHNMSRFACLFDRLDRQANHACAPGGEKVMVAFEQLGERGHLVGREPMNALDLGGCRRGLKARGQLGEPPRERDAPGSDALPETMLRHDRDVQLFEQFTL